MQISNCIFAVLCFGLVFSQRRKGISYMTPHIFKQVGNTVEITCVTEGTANSPMIWSRVVDSEPKNRNAIALATANTILTDDSRFSTRTEERENDVTSYTLQIKNIQENDTGRYRCRFVIGFALEMSTYVRLEVTEPQRIVIKEGESIRIQCFEGEVPPNNISWRRENNELSNMNYVLARGNILDITDVEIDDSGSYYCETDEGDVNSGTKYYFDVQVVE